MMRRSQAGFTYLGLLLAVAILGLGLALASEVWVTTAQRQRMAQLEWVGNQYAQAIGSYYESSPGRVKRFPKSIDDLLEDRRVLFTKRHLRQAYVNPLTHSMDWELIQAPQGGIRGVRVKLPPNGASAEGEPALREFAYSAMTHRP